MMHRLVWKIFFSFWLSLIVFAGASLTVASLFVEHARSEDANQSPRDRLKGYLEEARVVAVNDGVEGLSAWLEKLDRREVIPILLIDAQGRDLLDRPVSEHIADRIERRRHPAQRGIVQTAEGTEYNLVPDFRAVTLNRVLTRPRVVAFPLIAAAVISGLVSFFLARYLSQPIRRLSRATRQFGSGDLAMRVAPSLGGRRDEVAELAHDFDHMAEQLQALIAAQRQLLSDVSHELRSPLARLQVALGLARQRGPNQPFPELDRIEREAERLNDLIAQLLSLARLESDAGLPRTECVDLAALVAEIAESADYEVSASKRGVHVVASIPAHIEANPTLLHSALENVVRNAAKYTAEGTGVEVSLSTDGQRAGWVLVQVRDQGPGVPDDMLARLFDPFVRVGDARDRASGGYGLGLAIAKRAIQLHGGEIMARNHAEGGLAVSIQLPTDRIRSNS
jgi:two-component system sensor histidine kinase CpxA